MKKAIIVFAVILISLYVVLSLLIPKSPYVGERLFWKARTLTQQIMLNPKVTPPSLFKETRERYEFIIKEYPALAQESLISIGGILIQEEKYQEARDVLNRARMAYPEEKVFGARSQFLLGFSYEKEGNWDAAVREFRILMEAYPTTRLALQTPLYIARHDQRQDTQKGAESYGEAAQYYRRLIRQYSEGPVEFFALVHLLTSYREQKKWEESLAIAQEIITKYPTSVKAYIPTIETLSKRLNQPERAAKIFESFIASNPNHKDETLLKNRIELLGRKGRSGASEATTSSL